MNFAKLAPYLIIMVFAGSIWTLALFSHLAGNATAINALVGIPMGLVIVLPFFYLLMRGYSKGLDS